MTPLASGTKLGPFEIVAPIGEGGMGRVYRAQDPRLGRTVAIKVLPPDVAGHADRRRRFEQEARAASALNHPNIIAIYDIGTFEETLYIAMELVDGPTLRDALAGEPFPVRKIVEVAAQLAAGLAKAHTAGIVHRDLKPENVMLTRDGYCKILDFGLVKLVDAGAEPAELATASAVTRPGTVLGTAAYMSPEQAGGRPVGFAADQFSLGTLIYEMATGRRPFDRATTAETLTAIIREEPEPIAQRNPRIPAPLRWIVERCLAKDPEERYVSTADLSREIDTLKRHLAETSSGSGEIAAAEAARADALPTFQRLSFRRGTILSARFSSDGRSIVYGASWDGQSCRLYSTRPESPESSALALPDAEILAISSTGQMAISLDRRWAGRFIWSGMLAQTPLVGGAPRELLEDVQWADWSPDGHELAVVRRVGGKVRLEYPLDNVVYETAGWISHARVSPSGERVAFLDHPTQGSDGGGVVSVDRAGRATTHSDGWITAYGLAWARSDEIWFTATRIGVAREIWAVNLDRRERLLARTPAELTIHDVTPDGRALITSDNGQVGIAGRSSGDESERDLSLLDWSRVRDLTADGRYLLFDETGEGGGAMHSVYVRKMDGSPAVRLGEGFAGAFSPDGRWALARLPVSSGLSLLPVRAGTARSLDHDGLYPHHGSWLPDGQRILVLGNEPGRGLRLYVQALAGGAPEPITPEGISIGEFPVSPDGAVVVAQNADMGFWSYPIDGGEPTRIPSLGPDERPVRWTADGRGLFCYRRGAPPCPVFRLDVASGTKEAIRELNPPDPAGVVEIVSVQLTPDGASYAYSHHRILSDLFLVQGLG